MQQASDIQGTGAAYRVRMNGRLPLTDCRAACVVVAIVWPYRLCMLYSNSPFACLAVTGSVCARRQPLSQHPRFCSIPSMCEVLLQEFQRGLSAGHLGAERQVRGAVVDGIGRVEDAGRGQAAGIGIAGGARAALAGQLAHKVGGRRRAACVGHRRRDEPQRRFSPLAVALAS